MRYSLTLACDHAIVDAVVPWNSGGEEMGDFRDRIGKGRNPESLAECFWHCEDQRDRDDLERFRVAYEKAHGPTDLTKRYTSTWPIEEQRWLWIHDPVAYFDGLPEFVKAFNAARVNDYATHGELDRADDEWVALYTRGVLNNYIPGRGRR